MHLNVQMPCLKALVQFYDLKYRCFSIGDVDMTSAPKKYQLALIYPCPLTKIYLHFTRKFGYGKLSKCLHVRPKNLKPCITKKGKLKASLGGHFVKLFKSKTYVEENNYRLCVLALIIYDLVLPPLTPQIIGINVVTILIDMKKLQISQTTVILAKTFLTLNVCFKEGEGRLLCYTQLLFIWIASSLRNGPESSKSQYPYINPILDFANKTIAE